MACAACVAACERAIRKLEGVQNVAVNLTTGKVAVEYDELKASVSQIAEAISNAGYQVVDDGTTEKKTAKKQAAENTIRKQKEIQTLKIKFIVAAVFAVPLLYFAMAPMLPFYLPLPQGMDMMREPKTYALVQLLLCLPVVGVGYLFYTRGFVSLFRLHPNMDSLVAVGTSAAFLYSLFSLVNIRNGNPEYVHHLYFESTAIIIALILLGRFLETRSKGKTGQAIEKLIHLSPPTAILLRDGQEVEIAADDVQVGDIIVVKQGQSLPVDGIVRYGTSSVDESMLTGESLPVDKTIGDLVFAATINKNGLIHFEATKIGTDTALSKIISLVEEAQSSKAPIARLADKIAGIFVPVVMVIALAAALLWLLGGQEFSFALNIFVTVLIISCPCALGLATPTAIIVATGKAAEYGILFKSAGALEQLQAVKCVVLDKTGTITEGKPHLTDLLPTKTTTADELLLAAASAEKGSNHPLSLAITEAAKEKGLDLLPLQDYLTLPGLGIKTKINDNIILIGNKELMMKNNISLENELQQAEALAQEGKTPMYVAKEAQLLGIIAVADVIKADSRQAIARLNQTGVETIMLTGDNAQTAQAIAISSGIQEVIAQVLPDQKADRIKGLQKDGKRVAMVGDGINDAPALTQADVGIAIGSGTDVAIEAADVVLMQSSLMHVTFAMQVSHLTIRNIKQNLFWAFGYNVIGIPIAAGILYVFGGPLLNPMIAAAAMALSSVSVVTNALRLNGIKLQ